MNVCIRKGDYKLINFYDSDSVELFDQATIEVQAPGHF